MIHTSENLKFMKSQAVVKQDVFVKQYPPSRIIRGNSDLTQSESA